MISRKNKIIYLFLIAMVLLAGSLWLSNRPVKIVTVHQDRYISDILVKYFPLTAKGKIKWWFKNQKMLKKHYGIPKPDSDGYFNINFWLFGDGYKEEGKYDRLCFEDMKTNKNCIEKNYFFL